MSMWWTQQWWRERDTHSFEAEAALAKKVVATLLKFHSSTSRIHADARRENFVISNADSVDEKVLMMELGRSKPLCDLPILESSHNAIKLMDLLYILMNFYKSSENVTAEWMMLHNQLDQMLMSLFRPYALNLEPEELNQKLQEFLQVADITADEDVEDDEGEEAFESDEDEDPVIALRNQLRKELQEDAQEAGRIAQIERYGDTVLSRDELLQSIFSLKCFPITRRGACDKNIKKGTLCNFMDIIDN